MKLCVAILLCENENLRLELAEYEAENQQLQEQAIEVANALKQQRDSTIKLSLNYRNEGLIDILFSSGRR